MKNSDVNVLLGNKRNIFFFLSSTAFSMCLYFTPSIIPLMRLCVLYLFILFVCIRNRKNKELLRQNNQKLITIVLSLLTDAFAVYKFYSVWTPSAKVSALADAIGISLNILLIVVGLFLGVLAFFSFFVISDFLIRTVKKWSKKLPVNNKREVMQNLKKNWFLPFSAVAFLCLGINFGKDLLHMLIGVLISFIIFSVCASQTDSVFKSFKKKNLFVKIILVITSLGICLGIRNTLLDCKPIYFEYRSFIIESEPWNLILNIGSALLTVFAIPFVYWFLLVFWDKLADALKKINLFKEIKRAESVFYCLLIVCSVIFGAVVFSKTLAFYGVDIYDIIYTSDSYFIEHDNTYIFIQHIENDLRQPLFAVFSAPFVGVPYLITTLFGVSETIQAIILNSVQLVLLLLANLILADALNLSTTKRVCFIAISYCTYPYVLFSFMMEQYIIAYFWLILCASLICKKEFKNDIAVIGSGGTLLTSLALMPFAYENPSFRNLKNWFNHIEMSMIKFLIFLLAFGRFDVLADLRFKVSSLMKFSGKDLTLQDKFFQYTGFVRACFVAPNAGATDNAAGYISWQLNSVNCINVIGVIIFALAVISAIINRDKIISRIAAGWIAFSLVILVILGWGTKENGLILYALYFGWAFWVLLFQLTEKIENKLKVKFIIPIVSVAIAVALIAINTPEIIKMMNFAIEYYPA